MKLEYIFVGIIAAFFIMIGFAACDGGPTCQPGYVAEYDDDGWECEPDGDGNGVDDEEDD